VADTAPTVAPAAEPATQEANSDEPAQAAPRGRVRPWGSIEQSWKFSHP